MSVSCSRPTQLLVGEAGFAPWHATYTGRRTVVVVDAQVAGMPLAVRLHERFGRTKADLITLTGPGDLHSITALAKRLIGADLVVGIGGGSLLDQTKLATVLRDSPEAHKRLTIAQRGGLVVFPLSISRRVPLLAVPTTLGTGAEVSGVACLTSLHGKRLITAAALRPEAALLAPAATDTLPGELVAEGVLEALFRLVSPYVGDHHDLPSEDALVETVVCRLAVLGQAVSKARHSGQLPDGRLRLEIAKLSGLSHADWLHQGRDPYAVKGWLIANELSCALGIRKMTAVAALLPHLWRAILAGDPRWGSARRLIRIWAQIAASTPAGVMPEEPVRGITALIDHWRIGCQVSASADEVDAIAHRTVRAWGAGLPMLSGLGTDEVRALLHAAVTG